MTSSRPSLPRSDRSDLSGARHRLVLLVLLVLLAASLCPRPSAGQTTSEQATVDGGAALLAQDNTATVVAPTIGADWRRDAVRSTLRASGSATVAGSDRWAVQGVGAGSWYFGTAHTPRELGAVGSVLRLFGIPTSFAASAVARQHVSHGDAGAWIGGSAGLTVSGVTAAPVLGVDGAVWRRGSGWRTTLSLSALTALLDSAHADFEPAATHFSAVDVVGGVERQEPRLELAGNLGVRRSWWTGGSGPPPRTALFAVGSAVVPVHPAIALVLTAGNHIADPNRGAPAVRYVALSVRVRPAALRRTPKRVPPQVASPANDSDGMARDGAATTLLVSGDGETRTIRVSAPAARRVELRSDATGWRSVELVRREDHWETTIALAPGTHRVMLRLDDGEWLPPGNLPVVDDDFGGRVGLLVVP